ncbi:transmembrane protein 35B-like [Saccoglossus kowalevskii]
MDYMKYLLYGLALLYCLAGVAKLLPHGALTRYKQCYHRKTGSCRAGKVAITYYPKRDELIVFIYFQTKDFVRFASVFPLKNFGVHPNPATFQFVIGIAEMIGGVLLLWGPIRMKQISAIVLLVIMAGATWTLFQLGEPIGFVIFPALCGLGLLALLTNRKSKLKLE